MKIFDDIKIRVRRKDFDDAFGFLICEERRSTQKRRIVKPFSLALEPQEGSAEDTFSLPHDAARMLMDELWQCGLRPTDAKSGNEVIAAQKTNLEDLRKVINQQNEICKSVIAK